MKTTAPIITAILHAVLTAGIMTAAATAPAASAPSQMLPVLGMPNVRAVWNPESGKYQPVELNPRTARWEAAASDFESYRHVLAARRTNSTPPAVAGVADPGLETEIPPASNAMNRWWLPAVPPPPAARRQTATVAPVTAGPCVPCRPCGTINIRCQPRPCRIGPTSCPPATSTAGVRCAPAAPAGQRLVARGNVRSSSVSRRR
jgi:hypothetical protein